MNNKSLLLLITVFVMALAARAQVKDIDGHKYKTVKIGNQRWMAENLDVSRFRNGDTIPEAKKKSDWSNAEARKQPMCCYHELDSGKVLGRIYNWYAVNDPRGLAPKGWHVASDSDYSILFKQLGGDTSALDKLRTVNGWGKYKGTNTSGFSALPNNERANGGAFSTNSGHVASWWTSSGKPPGYGNNPSKAYYRMLFANTSIFNGSLINKNHGLYVRCIKD